MSTLEIIIYSLIGLGVIIYFIHTLFGKKKKENKPKTDNNNTTERD